MTQLRVALFVVALFIGLSGITFIASPPQALAGEGANDFFETTVSVDAVDQNNVSLFANACEEAFRLGLTKGPRVHATTHTTRVDFVGDNGLLARVHTTSGSGPVASVQYAHLIRQGFGQAQVDHFLGQTFKCRTDYKPGVKYSLRVERQ